MWTWDHFVPLSGDTDGPMFEAWELLAAWGAITTRVKIGTLVTGATYRNPALLAKMVATLDHITKGRAILGLGAAWHEDEHKMYGIPFLSTGGRLARLAEASEAIRMLLDQPFATLNGKYVKLTNALCEPKPVQARLPLLIGGGGERKTLRIVARFADYWHGHGTPEVIAHKLEVLKAHCAAVGRDISEITPLTTTRPNIVLRDTVAEVRAHWKQVAEAARMTEVPEPNPIHTVDTLVELLIRYWKAGARGFLFYSQEPFDHETITRIAEQVRPRLTEALP
ncbi:MAG: LLM class flavin-dependent oxidoreductase [Chloroflexi bacterium]|nr:LLM class flavin-dependent oxidoreductase [Chloroflexota bacterium]